MTTTLRLGRLLFHWRSITPVPVIAGILALLWFERNELATGRLEVLLALDVAGLLLAIAGQALRAWVLGQVPEGTSGQGNTLEASTLNTTGPYARVRNPLYVGNLLIVVGLLLMTQSLVAAALALAFFFGQYHFIIRAEEQFLRERFAKRFEAFYRSVPRWLPRLKPATDLPLSHRFAWRRSLRKEHNPFAAWMSGAVLLAGWQLWMRDAAGFYAVLPGLVAAEAALLSFYLVVKGWKRGWFLRESPREAKTSEVV
ncbi:MAG: methyltransferase family protein [Myxococcales bacterium]|jgi:protein-S-isoprenylcysteine O-methyltransferase Ste14